MVVLLLLFTVSHVDICVTEVSVCGKWSIGCTLVYCNAVGVWSGTQPCWIWVLVDSVVLVEERGLSNNSVPCIILGCDWWLGVVWVINEGIIDSWLVGAAACRGMFCSVSAADCDWWVSWILDSVSGNGGFQW